MKLSLPFLKSSKASQIQNIYSDTVYSLYQAQDKDTVFIDVREAFEWREGIIPGALKISLSELSGKIHSLDPNLNYVLVCRSGNRSLTAARMLEKAGFTQLSNFQGGMMAWQQKRYPLSK